MLAEAWGAFLKTNPSGDDAAVRKAWMGARAKALGLNYIHIPFNPGTPSDKPVDDFLAAVANKSNQPVFIHCGSASRVGAMWLVKRVLQDGWAVAREVLSPFPS